MPAGWEVVHAGTTHLEMTLARPGSGGDADGASEEGAGWEPAPECGQQDSWSPWEQVTGNAAPSRP